MPTVNQEIPIVRAFIGACLLGYFLAIPALVLGSETSEGSVEETDEESPWAATADLGLAFTEGNSATQTIALKGALGWTGEKNQVRFKFDGLRSDTTEDRYQQAVPGVTWEPGELVIVDTFLVEPELAADTEKYYLELRFDSAASNHPDWKITPGRLTWHAGTSWDRNLDAGIVGRTIAFAGTGNIWWHREGEELRTSYALSWTDRQETQPDPEKEDTFWGLRGDLNYVDRWGPYVTFDHDTTLNWNLEDTRDYSVDMTNEFAVPLGGRFSLKVSVRWLYNSQPSLEQIDIIALIVLRDPDEIPGNGDEYFETVEEGGAVYSIGTARQRKKNLDTVFKTSLSISF